MLRSSRREVRSLRYGVHRFSFNSTLDGSDERGVVFDEDAISGHVKRPLSPRVMDFVEIIASVHFADRMARRPSSNRAGASWSREFELQIGVREPGHWGSDSLSAEVASLLRWLTDDRWNIRYVRRQAASRSAERIQFLFDQPPDGDLVALFSGGLDSVAGVVDDVAAGRQPIALSVGANNRMRGRQAAILKSVGLALGGALSGLPVELHLRGKEAREQSQRARGFSFLGLAGAAVFALGLDEVHVYENGIGALNVPYTAAQTGAHGTRSMHPVTLVRMEALLQSAFESEIRITNTSRWLTKAEMCRKLGPAHHGIVASSQSCDTAFAARVSDGESCGVCTSCLLRRQSLRGAGLVALDEAERYRVDVKDVTDWMDPSLYPLRAMVMQVEQMRSALQSSQPWESLLLTFPDLSYVAGYGPPENRDGAIAGTVRLLGQYVNEWNAFPSSAVTGLLGRSTVLAPLEHRTES